jgi:hypothetical protein
MSEIRTERKTVPRYVAVLLVLLTLSMFVFTVTAAITSYVLFKPYVVGIIMSNSLVQVKSLSFSYNQTSARWNIATVEIINNDTIARSGTIGVFLYDSSSTIASGTATYTNLGSNSIVSISITLSWTSGKNVTDITSGKVVVSVS